MIKLYDFELSGSCYKVRLLLNILKVSCERIPVDFVNKEHKTERFLTLNPLGEIPVLEDGDVRLRDAQAILVYIARNYDRSNTWFPDAPESMGRIMQWLSFGGNELMAAAGARLVKILNYPLDLPALQARAIGTLRILDAHLSDREFLELGHPTIADIACFPYVAMAGEGGIELKPYPNVLRWIDRIKQIPGFIPMPGIPAIGAVAA
jgi:glutathione S-transferase